GQPCGIASRETYKNKITTACAVHVIITRTIGVNNLHTITYGHIRKTLPSRCHSAKIGPETQVGYSIPCFAALNGPREQKQSRNEKEDLVYLCFHLLAIGVNS